MEIALIGDVVALAEVPPVVLAEQLFDLGWGEEIVRALLAAAVRVLPAVESAAVRAQLAQAVIQRRLRDLTVQCHAAVLPRLGIA